MTDTGSREETKTNFSPDNYPAFLSRSVSSLNIKEDKTVEDVLNLGNKFFGNLVVQCAGKCGSPFSRLIVRIMINDKPTAADGQSWDPNDLAIVRSSFWTIHESLRLYLIKLLLIDDAMHRKYQSLYDTLIDKRHKITDSNADYVLDAFLRMYQNKDEYILQCLCNRTCMHKAVPLWQEIEKNIDAAEELADVEYLVEKVDEIHKHWIHKEMQAQDRGLTDKEILAIFVYSANDEFADSMQKHRKIDCKWKQTFYYFVKAILKIYDARVYQQPPENLPASLFHPTFLSFKDGVKPPLTILSTVNCTASKNAARDYAPPDGSMFEITNCKELLRNGTMIAAPIDWISPHPSEEEWVILPCQFNACEAPKPFVHKSTHIVVNDCRTLSVDFFGVDVQLKLSKLNFVRHLNGDIGGGADIPSDEEKENADDNNNNNNNRNRNSTRNRQQRSKASSSTQQRSLTSDPYSTYLVDAFVKRAEDAENKIVLLQQQLNVLITHQQSNAGTAAAAVAAAPSAIKPPPTVIGQLPWEVISDEAFDITEVGSAATMTVTACNGELNPPFISTRGLKWAMQNYASNELDIFVDTYPKCGTTLTIKLVHQILSAVGRKCAGASESNMNDPWISVPWIDVEVSQELRAKPTATEPAAFLQFVQTSNENKTTRLWKTHAPHCNFPARELGAHSKIIHVTRNPKDVMCSYFNFFRKEPFVKYTGDFDTLFDRFCDGSVVSSNFFDFELAWYRAYQRNPTQILWLAFEDFIRHPKQVIAKVADFVLKNERQNNNNSADTSNTLTEEQIESIANAISFSTMKSEAVSKGNSFLFNKGKIGNWRRKLSAQQSARMDRIVNARFRDTGLVFDFGDDN